MLELTTLTAAGKTENLGGIYGVATLPSHTRRGISTRLFRVVHDSFLGKGYRLSVLGTSRSLVSHAFYEKLGYVDQVEIPTAYKILKTRKIPAPKSVRFDYGMLLSIYRRYVKGKTGFVCRYTSYLRFLRAFNEFSHKEILIDRDGYAFFKKQRDGRWASVVLVRELIASSPEQMDSLIAQVELRAKDFICDRSVMDDGLLEVYSKRGYVIQNRSHSVITVKPPSPKPHSRRYMGTGSASQVWISSNQALQSQYRCQKFFRVQQSYR